MAKSYESYSLLPSDNEQLCDEILRDPSRRRPAKQFGNRFALAFISFGLSISLAANILQAYYRNSSQRDSNSFSRYAGLEESDVLVQWPQQSVYTDSNTSIADAAWNAINHDSGIVAVDKDWATSKGLPLGSTFPWDNNKTLYFLNAYHGLHCLKNIYRSFMEFRDNVPQSLPYHHITHCLDQLRADVLCNADDTPRVTTPDMRPVTGEGQWRRCRNWNKLEAWTFDNPGCFRYGNPIIEDEKPSQIARMRYCPDNSELLDRVRMYYGKGSDWFPARDRVFSWFEKE